MHQELTKAFDEVIEVVKDCYSGVFRAEGIYVMKFGKILYEDKPYQDLHTDEGAQLIHDGQIFHSRGFLSCLRPVGGPRFVDILKVGADEKFQV